ncbi:MAG: epoxide hydrolase [Alphaproteobacteria bacterium]|nr:epoxide hydrolase [Alphaproteobacteria bacterium]
MADLEPFEIKVPQERLDWIAERIDEYEWFEEPVDAGWQYGCNQDYLKELVKYWRHSYDWRDEEEALNVYPHFIAPVSVDEEEIDIHFIHQKGSNPENRPIILLHGWPGSFFELLHLCEPLSHPEKHGGKAEDGRDVIIPSLVGYGFSGPPSKPIGPRKQAEYMNGLMTDVLGFEDYVVQGGDWGALIAAWLGFDFGKPKDGPVHAIHMNMIGVRPGGDATAALGGSAVLAPETKEELEWAQKAGLRMATEMGYFMVQATKPQSLSYGMMDSPVGTAAWLTEKFENWSDLSGKGEMGGKLENTYTKDQLLTNIMLYIVTRRFNTAAWQYYGARTEGSFAFPKGEKCEVPTGVATYPVEIAVPPPRSYAEKGYNIVHWKDQPKGGHFAAFEQPELFLDDLRSFLSEWG